MVGQFVTGIGKIACSDSQDNVWVSRQKSTSLAIPASAPSVLDYRRPRILSSPPMPQDPENLKPASCCCTSFQNECPNQNRLIVWQNYLLTRTIPSQPITGPFRLLPHSPQSLFFLPPPSTISARAALRANPANAFPLRPTQNATNLAKMAIAMKMHSQRSACVCRKGVGVGTRPSASLPLRRASVSKACSTRSNADAGRVRNSRPNACARRAILREKGLAVQISIKMPVF